MPLASEGGDYVRTEVELVGYPFIVFLVSGGFCLAVARQYLRRHRPYQLAWAISLASAAAGSLSYVIFLAGDKPELAFRLYYIFGALMTAPLLGIGSLLLAAHTPAARRNVAWITAVVAVGLIFGGALLLTNPLHADLLHQLNGGPGSSPDVYKSGAWKPVLIVLNIVGALCVFGVAAYSGWQLYRRAGTRQLVAANALIALGTYVISQAGGQARTGFGAGAFWLTMTIGWVVLFGGFLCTFSYQSERRPARTLARQPDVARN